MEKYSAILHHALDLWARQWRRKFARGNVIVVRYADDSVFGFKSEETARRFLTAMQERLAKFGLTLNAKKTRLIEFGRFAATNRKRRGQSKPETFDFLGFTHCCGTDRQGRFKVVRLTVKERMRATLEAIRAELMRRRHESVAIVGKWLNRVVQGYVTLEQVQPYCQAFHSARPQRTSISWGAVLRVTYLRQEPYAVILHVRICAGGGGNLRPYRNQCFRRCATRTCTDMRISTGFLLWGCDAAESGVEVRGKRKIGAKIGLDGASVCRIYLTFP